MFETIEQEIVAKLNNKPIILIGMMGSGKTSIGKRLSKRLNLPFIDSDAELEKSAQMTINEIFHKYGEETFRDGERNYISKALSMGSQIISTGGGAFMDNQTQQNIKKQGISIWLKVPVHILLARVRSRGHRPLLNSGKLEETMTNLLKTREPIYSTADITIDVGNQSANATVQRICEALTKKLISTQCKL